jgi:hypothetical protein
VQVIPHNHCLLVVHLYISVWHSSCTYSITSSSIDRFSARLVAFRES